MTDPLLDGIMIAALAVVAVRWIALISFALLDVLFRRGRGRPAPSSSSQEAELVSVIIPAFNEERALTACVRGVVASEHEALEIIIVDDGSSDDTNLIARRLEHEHARVRLCVHPRNRGKAAALNTGIAAAYGDRLVTIDADTVPEPPAIPLLIAPLDDPAVAAVASNVKVSNRGRLLGRLQSVEYITALNLDRRAQAFVGAITTAPGAMSAWRRDAIVPLGGFSGETLTEDTDLTISLLRAGHQVAFADRAVARTEAPACWADLFRQRRRWLYGNLQNAWRHRGALAGGSRPALGWLGLPNFWFAQLFVYALFPLSLLYLPRAWGLFAAWELAGLAVGLLGLDLILALAAYIIDHENKQELWWAPAQRLCFPFFLWSVFAAVMTRMARGRPLDWHPRASRE